MSPSIPLARRGTSVASHASLTERLFASSGDRRMARSIDDGLALVEEQLLREVRFADDVADVTTRYLLDAGGKRVRPMLALLIAQLGEGNTQQVVDAAVAIEITHLASLYHDDVMDEADMRRGVPSAQAVWGNSIAILAGDLLFARASKIVADLGPRAIRLQAATFERLVLGQLHETIGPREGQDPIEHYLDVLADKTGSLIACAAQMGVIYSGADPELESAVVAFGERTGVAFQLVDDVLDLADQPEETGKLAGTDLRAGVSTLPLLYLTRLAATDPDAAALLARIQRDVEHEETPETEADLTAAIAELRDHEVTARTIAEAHRWAAEAVDALAPLPEGPVKKALTRFADTIVERTR
ncbi:MULTISPECIES: polyprenyl synthetase family protein [Clavibacter]|uniref:Geranylgeranyl pyrophosphate synthase n=1 Tax=Clavibacter tessellarius TaxID=31965 RepID=A0A154V0X3_9MICO|nr:polyprenyl synthetase family protein [Clavibacter michiganensis]KZC95025.1 geranylgeranyl pyrophosphate synthase [Clavibacter michiganensis subsp. tessellarius]